MANSVDPDQMPRSAASDLGLHCLLRPVCLSEFLGEVRYYLTCPHEKINVINF